MHSYGFKSCECSDPSCDSYLSLRAVISSSFHCFYSHFRWYWSSCHNVKGYVIYTVWAPQISLFCIFYLQDIVRSLIYEWMWHLLKPHFSYCKYIRNTCIVMYVWICDTFIRVCDTLYKETMLIILHQCIYYTIFI